ncbi:MAG: hypothetical protein J2P45_05065 [Candidatus Dormibacteraeota bacterium]|nr:hypothetical protein [Candidatus Dormibacteraeota bacterium]
MEVSFGHWTAADVGLIVVLLLAVAIVVAIGVRVLRAAGSRPGGQP